MQRTYEIMFIVRPDILDEDLDKLIAGLEANITQGGGSIKSMEKLGRRKLAYTVKKFNDGNYVLLTINADGSLVGEIERRLRLSEPVIKFKSLRMDEEEKRVANIKAIRATRKKLSSLPAATPPAPVEAARATAPAAEAASALGILKGIGTLWLTKPAHPAHQAAPGPRVPGLGLPVPVDGRPAAVPAVLAAADANSSAARKFANSAWRRSTRFTTAMCGCCSSLSPSGAR